MFDFVVVRSNYVGGPGACKQSPLDLRRCPAQDHGITRGDRTSRNSTMGRRDWPSHLTPTLPINTSNFRICLILPENNTRLTSSLSVECGLV